jgi:hypothetical protein
VAAGLLGVGGSLLGAGTPGAEAAAGSIGSLVGLCVGGIVGRGATGGQVFFHDEFELQ